MPVQRALLKGTACVAVVCALVFGLTIRAGAGNKLRPPEGLRVVSASAGPGPELSATLSDPEGKAQQHTATVEVQIEGIQLIDPAAVHEQPRPGQGHLHYQLDTGPVIATTSTKLSFHELSSGVHEITVRLVGNDHKSLGPREVLTVTIPPPSGDRAQR